MTHSHSESTFLSGFLLACLAMVCLMTTPLFSAPAEAEEGVSKAYVIGQLSGPLADALHTHLEDLDLPKPPPLQKTEGAEAVDTPAPEVAAPVVLAGPSVATLGDNSRAVLRQAFADGWPIALVDATVDQINRLHEITGSGQAYEVPAAGRPPEAFAFVRRADGTYSQRSAEVLGSSSFAAPLRADRALGLIRWLHEARAQSVAGTANAATAQADSSGPAELDDLVSAWTDTRTFFFTWDGAQSTFQCVQEVWQAYQVSTKNDFYYMDQVCNFSPNDTYQVRGKKLETPTVFSNQDWDDVSWSVTDKYCVPSSDSGDTWSACDYLHYATQYQMNLQPYSADGSGVVDASLVTLIQENPQTTSENSTVTHGVSWSVGGEVVAGESGASASVNAGVQVENQTTTTIPAYTIQNHSLNGTQNAAWTYSIAPVTYIDDSCTNTMNAPQDIQIQTFETTQDLIWQVQPGYRTSPGFDGHFKVHLDVSAQLYESTMYVDSDGSWGVTNLSDCNLFGCSCSIVTNSTTPSLSPVILSIPVPSTDYEG